MLRNLVIARSSSHWRGNPYSCNAQHCSRVARQFNKPLNDNLPAHLPVLWEIWTAEWEIHKLFTQNDIFPLAFSGQFGYDMLALRDKEC